MGLGSSLGLKACISTLFDCTNILPMCPRVLEPSSAVEDGLESLVGDVVHLLLGDRRSAGSCVLEAEQPQPPLGAGGEVAGDGGQGGHGDVWRRGRPGSDWGVLTPGPATPRPAPAPSPDTAPQ